MPKLILLRHGQSKFNLENKFTGELDIDLTIKGEQEAKNAGRLLKNFPIDMAFTSCLKRAAHSLNLMLIEMSVHVPIFASSALNERNYGDLQGLNKAETTFKYGFKKVQSWRRSFVAKPPGGESLKDTYDRVVPYYQKEIWPQLKLNKNILVVAHGNSIRALGMYIQKLGPQEVETLEIATGIPMIYEFSLTMQLLKFENI
jgi:2,3-bisphosphoglycerate-dependent phosphoglycerate mutase